MMKKLMLLLIIILIIIENGCKTIDICGFGQPEHKINFINDSIFTYTKWKLPWDQNDNSIGLYSKGKYVKIDKSTFLLNSERFNANSFPCEYKMYYDSTVNGLKIIVSTDIFNDDFKFDNCKLLVDIDSSKFKFEKNVDTIINISSPNIIHIKLDISANKNNPPIRYKYFDISPIYNSNSHFNCVNIHIPISSKSFYWFEINNATLKKINKRKYFLDNDKWEVSVKK